MAAAIATLRDIKANRDRLLAGIAETSEYFRGRLQQLESGVDDRQEDGRERAGRPVPLDMSRVRAGTLAALGLILCCAPARAEEPGQVSSGSPAPVAASSPAPPAIPNEPWRPDDKRRTLHSYGTNITHNFIAVWSPAENGRALLATAALTAPSFAVDDEVIAYFERHPHRDFGRIGASLGGSLAAAGVTIGLFSAGRYAHNDRFRAATYDASQAVIINQVYTQALKFAVRRERPDQSNNQSFPSGHASNAFTIASVAAHHYPRLAAPAYGVATFIAVSRLAATRHHFSDIVAGAGFGFGVGKVVVHRNGRPPDTPPPHGVMLAPDPGPSGDGAGMAVLLHF